MYTSDSMTFLQTLICSGLGFCTVFLCLIALSVAILIFSAIFRAGSKGRNKQAKPVTAAPAAPAAPAVDEESYAAVIAAVSEETKLPLNQFQITSIRELH